MMISVQPVTGGEYLRIAEACKIARVSRTTLWRWTRQGLPVCGRGNRQRRLIRRSDLDRWLTEIAAT